MKTVTLLKTGAALVLGAAILLPAAASAHRAWFKPSATVFSGDEGWLAVDAAIGNELFYFDHHALPLDDVTAYAPDGDEVSLLNTSSGEYRSTFDVHLEEEGTYRITRDRKYLFGTYVMDGETQRWRGMMNDVPEGAEDVTATQMNIRVDTFATLGAPSDIAATGEGLEFEYITHPTDLFAGETATFRVLMEGEPVPGIEVAVIPGGNRYRNELGEMSVTSDEDGMVEVTWPDANLYWLNAELEDDNPSIEGASGRRASYVVTLEVLPQ